ncbi:MAG: TlpA disulfide reductase family protein [Ferruginibacter sp.]
MTAVFAGNAQTDTANDYVNKFLTIPAFRINTAPDSSFYGNEQLKKNAPFMIMFFSPDCDHCQKQTKELLAYKNELKNIQIIMVSALPYNDSKNFYNEYGLASMPNVKLGTDPSYKLRQIYRLQPMPAMYVYDKNGTLAKAFVGNISVPSILDAVK